MRRFILAVAIVFVCAVPVHLQRAGRTGDWRYYGGDAGSQKYSPLDQIQSGNVGKLRVAWRWTSPDNTFAAAHPTSCPARTKTRRWPSTDGSTPSPASGVIVAIDPATDRRYGSTILRAGKRPPPNLGYNIAGSPTGPTAQRADHRRHA